MESISIFEFCRDEFVLGFFKLAEGDRVNPKQIPFRVRAAIDLNLLPHNPEKACKQVRCAVGPSAYTSNDSNLATRQVQLGILGNIKRRLRSFLVFYRFTFVYLASDANVMLASFKLVLVLSPALCGSLNFSRFSAAEEAG